MRDLLIVMIVLFFSFGVFIGFNFKDRPHIEYDLGSYKQPNLSDCTNYVLRQVFGEKISLSSWKETNEICINLVQKQGELNDFVIRRVKFFQQQYDEKVMLWMVVGITLSGVLLAGLQLAASYQLAGASKLAEFTTSSDITVEQGKLVVKSSVTGLMILIVSFAFFLVFVLEIYTIKEVKVDVSRQGNLSSILRAGTGEYVEQGGLGLPPVASPSKK